MGRLLARRARVILLQLTDFLAGPIGRGRQSAQSSQIPRDPRGLCLIAASSHHRPLQRGDILQLVIIRKLSTHTFTRLAVYTAASLLALLLHSQNLFS